MPRYIDKVYVGDVGVELYFDADQDVSTAIDHHVKVKKPDGTTDEWDTQIADIDSVTNYLRHITVEGDLDQAGIYEFQVFAHLAGGWKGCGETARLPVREKFT